MSKAQQPNAWDARDAFHRATTTVYADLGALVDVLKTEPDLRIALLVFDEYATPGSVPDGDPEFVADLKHTASRLRSSLRTVERIRRTAGHAACAFGNGGSFGCIGTVSHHEALLDAAAEVLQPDAEGASRSGRTARPQSASGAIRRQVIKAVMDPIAWARLAENLKHEYELALLHDHSPTSEPTPEYDARVAQLEEQRLELKRPEVAKATSAKDVAALFKLWESTTDILFRTNPGAVLSRPEELFHLKQIVFALAAVADDEGHPHSAMNKLSELLNRLMPLEWFDNPQDKRDVAEAVSCAGDEIRNFNFQHRRAKQQTSAVPPPVSSPLVPPAATPPVAPAQELRGDVVNAHDLIQHKVAARMLGKKPPELSDWVRKIADTGWAPSSWPDSKDRFHYLLMRFGGGRFLRSRILELQLWIEGLKNKPRGSAKKPRQRRDGGAANSVG